ncbi:hypothetical protein OZH62_21540 [Escherichia coli]|uniref:gp53-like domain-containing protein n=1 Tax=Escherichia coli TaxID=562 RepID=UPI002281640C|nr:hypothetical protein [Escherichia coli]MCZ0203400.1 hypothetical protein [Escherichia coli]MCZ0269466.1 hypothetical protein [Escherichia coli]MCZ0273933.1 hypothetical protein [Escherichia coli]MCZ0282878.1 hypothetical protein [Escherichia coli]
MATNNFKAFAIDPNANVMSQADWEALPALLSGFTAGKASSAQVNKAIRQATTIAALVGQFIANSGVDALDNADVNGLVTKFTNALTTNLGLGGAAKLDAASASFGGNGWLRLPVLLGTDKKTLIIQWGYGTAGASNSTGLVCNFPFTFPNDVFTVMTGNLDQPYTSAATPGTIGFCNLTRSSITAKSTLSTSEQFGYLAIGY